MSQFSNTGLHTAEGLFVRAHERAAQYLDQAPVLVMFARLYQESPGAVGWRVRSLCERGVALRDFMRALDFEPPMRRLHASVLQPSHAGLYAIISHQLPPAVLGRVIPESAKAQRRWLKHLSLWVDHRRSTQHQHSLLVWAAEHLADATYEQVGDLRDFQLSGEPFNPAWGLKRAIREMEAWHARITLAQQLKKLPVGADAVIDLGNHPDQIEVAGYTLTALRTPRQLAEEGSAMRHCVATYLKRVFDGQSHVVSITKDGERIATLDFGNAFQVRGPHNAAVSPAVSSLARLYAEIQADRRRSHSSPVLD